MANDLGFLYLGIHVMFFYSLVLYGRTNIQSTLYAKQLVTTLVGFLPSVLSDL